MKIKTIRNHLFHSHEFIIALIIMLLSVTIAFINPAFVSLSNLFDLLKSCVVMGIMSIGVLIVLISGGIDISFTAIAAFSMYVTSKLLIASGATESLILAFVIAGTVGLMLGMFNAALISFFKMPTLIVTLGTASLFRGFLLAFIGTRVIVNLPQSMIDFSRMTLFNHVLPSGESIGLSISVFYLAAIAIFVWFLLRFTLIGRGIYALGGAPIAAARVGFNITRLQFFIYSLVGLLSGIAGIIHASMMRNSNPFDLVGTELLVIAAVVLGGTSITGGRGSVLGTMLGVLMLVIINNSMILLGIPSYWQRVVIGLIIIIGTGISVRRNIHRRD